ncbi:MAG: site-specific integrase [Chloracidobacterium sp.]
MMRDTTLDACRHLFLAGLASETTRRVYRAALDQFERWLRPQGKNWLEVTPDDIQAFRDRLLAQVAPPTVGVRLVALRRFYAQLVADRLTTSNPARIVGPSTSGRRRNRGAELPLTVLLTLPDVRTLVGARDALVLRLLGEAGLRVSEICALRQRDVTRRPDVAATGLGLVVGRGTRRARVVPLSPSLKAALDAYLRLDLPLRQMAQGSEPDAALIQATAANRPIGGRPLTPRCMFNLVRRYGSLLDRPDLNPQMMRRAAARASV